MELTVVLDSPQTEGFSHLSIDVFVEDYSPEILDKETLVVKATATVSYSLMQCCVEREDDSVLDFDEDEEDTLLSILSLEDQQAIEEAIIEELKYTPLVKGE